jgi:hypothetical protein
VKFAMAIDGIFFKDGSMRARRLGGKNIQIFSLSLLSNEENKKNMMSMHIERGSLMLMHIEMGRNLAY